MTGEGLAPYALFAGVLAMAGLPLYIHAPKVFAEANGVSLAAMGGVLFALRLLDVVQDPLLGRLAEVSGRWRAVAVGIAGGVMACGMAGLFAVTPPVAPLIWFAAMLTLVFSSYSFLTICFYARGVARAEDMGEDGHLRLARWRETGALLGVCIASVAPVALAVLTDAPYAAFALGFAVMVLLAVMAMQSEWTGAAPAEGSQLKPVLRDPVARRLLLVGLLNASPVAVTATLFLYFVESRLQAPGAEGPLLLLFFLSAAAAAPLWGRLAEAFGAKRVLLGAMALSIAAFALVPLLGPGDVAAFAAICLVSGAALAADLTLLPALFAKRMARVSPSAAAGFGLWSFVSKFALSLAALVLLPALEVAGFTPGGPNEESALRTLALLYAGLPCLLKAAAIILLAAARLEASPED
ncbi:sugar:cation symporter [Marinibacterium profundimaris]|uniref:Sugar:cation symporter n=2 Tax=Marinibacterium profundimaris TaxID=1679460 RepID=A0A225NQX2_9RHOB|nr:sugar:cation symporter [Marinibacterium profundimaris]